MAPWLPINPVVTHTWESLGLSWVPVSVRAAAEARGWDAPHAFALLGAVAVPAMLIIALVLSQMCTERVSRAGARQRVHDHHE